MLQMMMDNLLCKLLWGQLQSLGLFREKNQVMAELKTKIGLKDLYHGWLEESTAILERNNYLQSDGQLYTVMDAASSDIDAVWKQWDQQKKQWLEDPNMKAQVILLEAAVRALPPGSGGDPESGDRPVLAAGGRRVSRGAARGWQIPGSW